MEDLVTSVEGHTAFVKINRSPNNHFDSELISQIADFLEEQDNNIECRSIILCSEGKHFCAGADFTRSSFKEESDAYASLYEQAVRLFRTKKPIIAVIQGAAVGGGLGVSLAADFRVACPEARFSANFSKLGFHQGFGTSITLPRVVGEQKAKWMLLTSARLTGEEAYKIVQKNAMKSWNDNSLFYENIASDKIITNKIPVNKLKKLFNFSYHTKRINIIFNRSLKKIK